jgi:hypothetical protein
MAYEAVPVDLEIQKLTAAERDALSRYKTHENINTFLANENVPVVIGGFIASFFAVKLAEDIISDLESRVGKVSAGIKEGIEETVTKKYTFGGAPVGVSLEEILKALPEAAWEKLPF